MSVPFSLCPRTIKRLLSLCPAGQENPVPLETLLATKGLMVEIEILQILAIQKRTETRALQNGANLSLTFAIFPSFIRLQRIPNHLSKYKNSILGT